MKMALPHKRRWLRAAGAGALAMAGSVAMAADGRHNVVDDAWSTPQGHRFSGRLTEAHNPAAADSGRRSSSYRTTRLLLTRGETGTVAWTVGDLRWETRCDSAGYWALASNLSLDRAALALTPGWHDIASVPAASSAASLLVHDPRNTRGLISDIDDTILVSEVNSKRRLLRNSLTLPPEARQAVAGAATAYRRLVQDNPNPAATPVFYVSASPRQLTDSVRRFLARHDFPRGVLQLKEVSGASGESLTDQKAYKLRRIEAILAAFPGVRFVLMGDDGEQDPEIFHTLRERHPAQVGKVWIRRVHPDPMRPTWPAQRNMDELVAPTP